MHAPRGSRGVSILAAFIFVLLLSGATIGLLTAGQDGATSQTASVELALAPATGDTGAVKVVSAPANVNTDSKLTSDAPKSCDEAIARALQAHALSDYETVSQDKGTAGTLDKCYGAYAKVKTPKTAADYQCVGRQGKAVIDSGTVTVTTSPIPLTTKSNPGECQIEQCQNDASGKQVCKAAQLFKGGIASTYPTGSSQPALSTGSGVPPVDIPGSPSGSGQVGNAFNQDEYNKLYMACSGSNAATCDSTDVNRLNQLGSQATDVQKQIAQYTAACTGDNAATCDSTDIAKLNQLQQQDALNRYSAACTGTNAANCDPTDLNKIKQLQSPPPPPGPVPPPGPGAAPQPQPSNTFGGLGGLGSLLSGLARGLSQPSAPQQAPAQSCSTDPNVYAQQQQQYQQQLQQYNYQLQQYNNQQYYNNGYGGAYLQPPVQPSPCSPSTGSQCQSQPPQPAASACSAGHWQAQYSGSCVTGWQCIGGPKAALSCQPQVADVGMTLAIAYSCSSGTASSTGFTITDPQSGSATTTVADPPANANTATYNLTCTDNGQTSGALCSVQVERPSIILVANPKAVDSGKTSLIGWITSAMKSCVISSPDDSDFTSRNAANTSVAGTATTSAIASTTSYLLHCETNAGGTRDATTSVSVK